jgi:hypothetical protein
MVGKYEVARGMGGKGVNCEEESRPGMVEGVERMRIRVEG